MVEIKNSEITSDSECEWDNLDNFMSNFARSNESMAVEINDTRESRSPAASQKSKTSSKYSAGNQNINPVSYTRVAEVSKKLMTENNTEFTDKYNGLHSDIKNLLLELQEIKKARIDLQTKLESLG